MERKHHKSALRVTPATPDILSLRISMQPNQRAGFHLAKARAPEKRDRVPSRGYIHHEYLFICINKYLSVCGHLGCTRNLETKDGLASDETNAGRVAADQTSGNRKTPSRKTRERMPPSGAYFLNRRNRYYLQGLTPLLIELSISDNYYLFLFNELW